MIPFPEKKFSIILADPPWSYNDKACAGERGAAFKYSCMSLEEIKALPVRGIAADNAILFLWVTFPFIFEAKEVMTAWGFIYKTVGFVWVKGCRKAHGKLFWGMGNWTRSNPEVCLIGIRGKPKRVVANVHSVIHSPIREHSRKPDEVRDRIVQLCGDLPRIELFARQRMPGWDAWGNQIGEEK